MYFIAQIIINRPSTVEAWFGDRERRESICPVATSIGATEQRHEIPFPHYVFCGICEQDIKAAKPAL